MPQISAFARAMSASRSDSSNEGNMIDGSTATYGTHTENAFGTSKVWFFGFDFSALPHNALAIHNGQKPLKVTVRGSADSSISLYLKNVLVYVNGANSWGWRLNTTLISSGHSVANVYWNNGTLENEAGLASNLRDGNGANYKGFFSGGESGIPSDYTGVVLYFEGSNTSLFSKKSYNIYSVMLTLEYEVPEYTPPIYVGNKRADVYVGNKKVNGIYRGTTLIT